VPGEAEGIVKEELQAEMLLRSNRSFGKERKQEKDEKDENKRRTRRTRRTKTREGLIIQYEFLGRYEPDMNGILERTPLG
jgi:hypothetical protein